MLPKSQQAGAIRPYHGQMLRPGVAHPGLYLDKCRSAPSDSLFGSLIAEVAHEVGVERRALIVRVLLHLPRAATWKGWVSERQLRRQIRICAHRLGKEVAAAAKYVPAESFLLSQLNFQRLGEAQAQPVLTHLHYLGTARPGSSYFALVDPVYGLPVAICGVSEFQWKRVASQLLRQFRISKERVLDISRVYAVDSAPANSISTLLSHVRRWVRRNETSVELLTTAVDRNLGFSGASYRAANWRPWIMIKARPYLYENQRHVTPRQLRERYGTSNFDELKAKFPGRFERSKSNLLDPIIYCCRVNGETEVVRPEEIHRLNR